MSNLTRTVVKLSLSAFAAPSTVLSCLKNGNDYALKAGKPNNTPKELFLTGEFKSGVLAGAQNAAIVRIHFHTFEVWLLIILHNSVARESQGDKQEGVRCRSRAEEGNP